MSVLVQCVVGQLELQEGDRLLHPVAAAGRRVGVDVRPAGRLRLRLPCHLPLLLVPLQGGGSKEGSKEDEIWMNARRRKGMEGKSEGGVKEGEKVS